MSRWNNNIYLREYRRILGKINARAEDMRALSDDELKALTPQFKDMLSRGKTTDDILVDAYAAVREAAKRVLGMYPFDVQVIGAIALSKGKIAQMRTGEGKTLVATMPLYLNALTGKSTILVTMNEYLAARDGEQMSALFSFMGLTTGIGVPKEPGIRMSAQEKRAVYASDIVYTTHSVLGFDYLLQNLGASKGDLYLRDYYYVIIDEADSVLLDSAQTPLVISGMPRVQSNLYGLADDFVCTLQEGEDYIVEEARQSYLTNAGARRAERYFRLDNLYDQENYELLRHIVLALHAHTLFARQEQYVVEDNKVMLLDAQTGRIMDSTKLGGGMHQALEAKEHVPLTQESRAMASITYQSFFNMFPRISGMSGTALVDAEEFRQIYGLDVVEIPTNHPVQRIDMEDVAYYDEASMMRAALQEAEELHKTGRPVLVITNSVQQSDDFSRFLLHDGIPHNVLNAYNIAKEAEIIKEGGQRDAVTVATAIAGRGTDIKLGPGIEEMGGLAVIGLGRMDNRRQEQQGRGRAGRQGNKGTSRFYVCLEDEVVKKNGDPDLQQLAAEYSGPAPSWVLHRINAAQLAGEKRARRARSSTMEFGESMKAQRDLVYRMRNRFIENGITDKSYYMAVEDTVIDEFLAGYTGAPAAQRSASAGGGLTESGTGGRKGVPESADVVRFILDNITYTLKEFPTAEDVADAGHIRSYLHELASEEFDHKRGELHTERQTENFYRLMTLKALDNAWIEQVDYLQQLRLAVTGRAYAQRNVMYEYHKEAYASFEKMIMQVKRDMMRNIFLGEIRYDDRGRGSVLLP